MSQDILTAIALVIVVEGLIYALFPGLAKRMAASILGLPEGRLRAVGLGAVAFGVFMVWVIRG